jgi:hypothetical protein
MVMGDEATLVPLITEEAPPEDTWVPSCSVTAAFTNTVCPATKVSWDVVYVLVLKVETATWRLLNRLTCWTADPVLVPAVADIVMGQSKPCGKASELMAV